MCFISVTFVPGIEIEIEGGGGERELRCSSKGKQLKKLKEEGSGWGGDRVVTKKIILLSPPVNNTNLINLFTRHCTYQSPGKSIRSFFPFGTQHQNYKYSVSNE